MREEARGQDRGPVTDGRLVLGWSLDLITLALTLGDTCIGCMVGVVQWHCAGLCGCCAAQDAECRMHLSLLASPSPPQLMSCPVSSPRPTSPSPTR